MNLNKSLVISEELYAALMELVEECNNYDGIAQTDNDLQYGPESALGKINDIIKKEK